MRVFVGYGYNERDAWVERDLYRILRCAGFTVWDGKDAHGKELSESVIRKLDQSDAAVGFFTIRDGQGDADYTSHIWVRDEMVYAAKAKKIPVVPVHEAGVKVPDGMLGNMGHIKLDPNDRLACIADIMSALGNRNMRRVRLDPGSDALATSLWAWRHDPNFKIQYRTRDEYGYDSEFRDGRLDLVELAFFLNVLDVPNKAQIDLQGVLGGHICFSSGFVSTNATVPVRIVAHP